MSSEISAEASLASQGPHLSAVAANVVSKHVQLATSQIMPIDHRSRLQCPISMRSFLAVDWLETPLRLS